MYSIKKVAELSGVSVRTLHHYDAIGLLPPSARTDSGYRRYGGADLLRLQEILAWRQLGFSLRETRALMDDPGYDRGSALRRQRELALTRRASLAAMIAALDAAIEALEAETPIEEARMFEGLDPDPFGEEAQRLYGSTSQYAESRRRTAGYGEAEWKRLGEEADEIARAFADLHTGGRSPGAAEALAVAERHRAFIGRWFYDCPPGLHRGLGELYVADQRFRASWDRHGEGLAEFVRDALVANAATG